MTIAVSALCAEVVSAATYYVSPDGSGEAFTRDKPGALQDAFDKVTATYAAYAKGGAPKSFDAGDVVILKKGLYDFSTSEGVTPTFGAGNSYGYVSANWLTIRADDDCEKPADVTILGGGERCRGTGASALLASASPTARRSADLAARSTATMPLRASRPPC